MRSIDALPSWVPRTLAALLGLVLVLLVAMLVVVIRYVPQLADGATALPDAVALVDEAPSTMEQVERIDGNVEQVVPPVLSLLDEVPDLVRPLHTLITQAGLLHDDVADLSQVGDSVAGLQRDLAGLKTQLAALEQLGEPLTQLAGTAETLPASLDQLNTSAAALAALPAMFDQLVASLARMEEAVVNLDRKTGPVLLPDFSQ